MEVKTYVWLILFVYIYSIYIYINISLVCLGGGFFNIVLFLLLLFVDFHWFRAVICLICSCFMLVSLRDGGFTDCSFLICFACENMVNFYCAA